MRFSRMTSQWSVACLALLAGFFISQVWAQKADARRSMGAHGGGNNGHPVDTGKVSNVGTELLAMCSFCDEWATKSATGDICIRSYPFVADAGTLTGSENAMGLTGCSYPPCTEISIRADKPDAGCASPTSFPAAEQKLACAACRSLCPFSAGDAHNEP